LAKKYNKISKEEVLELFWDKKIISRAYICKNLACSVYSARKIIEDLQDDKLIRITNHGYVLVKELKIE